MTTASSTYDPKALAIARAVQRETGAENVILFGSRARGDYRQDSDIDLLVIRPGPKDYEFRASAIDSAKSMAWVLYGSPVGVDLVWFLPEEFDRMRHSINSVAAIAAEEGFTMDGQPAGNVYSGDDEDHSDEWSNTGSRCYHARSHLHLLRGAIDLGAASIMVGQQAHQTLEHAMKALISAAGRRYPHHHELLDLERAVRRAVPEFTHPLESPLGALNDYGGGLKYDAPYASFGDANELYRQVERDVHQIFQRVAELTGRDPWQEQT